jgi:hypothetical protein
MVSKSARGLAHSKTLARNMEDGWNFRQGLECGCPLPLLSRPMFSSESALQRVERGLHVVALALPVGEPLLVFR